jgi:hypothetical protein
VAVPVPGGFLAKAVEVHFGPSAVDLIPDEIGVFATSSRRTRLNEGRSGEWLASLAADALVHRALPMATIVLSRPESGELLLEFRTATTPPIDRIVLIGETAR